MLSYSTMNHSFSIKNTQIQCKISAGKNKNLQKKRQKHPQIHLLTHTSLHPSPPTPLLSAMLSVNCSLFGSYDMPAGEQSLMNLCSGGMLQLLFTSFLSKSWILSSTLDWNAHIGTGKSSCLAVYLDQHQQLSIAVLMIICFASTRYAPRCFGFNGTNKLYFGAVYLVSRDQHLQ